jgi:hypothetical protein
VADQKTTAPPATGFLARTLAAMVAGHGYQVEFPSGRDPAMFKVSGLPGSPDVEVTAEEDGSAGCYYTGRSAPEAAQVIDRLPAPGLSSAVLATSDVQLSTWDGIDVEWHYLPPAGQPADLGYLAGLLLAHLAVLAGQPATEEGP